MSGVVRYRMIDPGSRYRMVERPDIPHVNVVLASDYDRDTQALQRRVEELEGALQKEQRLDEVAEKMVALTDAHLEKMPRSELIALVYKNMHSFSLESIEIKALEKQVDALTARLAACQEALNILVNAIGNHLYDDFYGCCIFCEKNEAEEPPHKETCPYQLAAKALTQEDKG